MVYKVFCDREYRLNLKFENIYISLRFNFIVNKLRFYWQLIKMVIRSRENSIGAWAFLIGVILAVIVGIFAGSYTNPLLLLIIVILGLVVGYFVPEKNAQTFLFASMASLIASFAGIQGLATDVALRGITVSGVQITKMMVSILGALLFLFIPATIIVAIKTVFSIAKV